MALGNHQVWQGVNIGYVVGRVVGRIAIAAAGNRRRISHRGWRIASDVHRQSNCRVVCAGCQRIAASAPESRRNRAAPSRPGNSCRRQARGQSVCHRHRAGGCCASNVR